MNEAEKIQIEKQLHAIKLKLSKEFEEKQAIYSQCDDLIEIYIKYLKQLNPTPHQENTLPMAYRNYLYGLCCKYLRYGYAETLDNNENILHGDSFANVQTQLIKIIEKAQQKHPHQKISYQRLNHYIKKACVHNDYDQHILMNLLMYHNSQYLDVRHLNYRIDIKIRTIEKYWQKNDFQKKSLIMKLSRLKKWTFSNFNQNTLLSIEAKWFLDDLQVKSKKDLHNSLKNNHLNYLNFPVSFQYLTYQDILKTLPTMFRDNINMELFSSI